MTIATQANVPATVSPMRALAQVLVNKPASTDNKPKSRAVPKGTMAQVTGEKTGPVSKPVVKASLDLKFYPLDGARPSKVDTRLFSYTVAWLSASGMLDEGTSITRATARKVAGDTALSHHSKKGNFADTGTMVSLTPEGKAFFLQRRNEPALVEAWVNFFSTGKTSPDTVKNAQFVGSL